MRPGEVNAIVARARRCLLAGRLIGLAFDPLAHSEGWGVGVMGAPLAAFPSIPHPSSRPTIIYLSPLLLCIPQCLVSPHTSPS